jgi:hypothetical protein
VTAAVGRVDSCGDSLWLTPRTSFGREGLFRSDHYEPNQATGTRRRETIAGVAYWLPARQAPLTAAVLLDYDAALAKPAEKRWELKALLSF